MLSVASQGMLERSQPSELGRLRKELQGRLRERRQTGGRLVQPHDLPLARQNHEIT